jgi:20S proteasome alpha/beta subunit
VRTGKGKKSPLAAAGPAAAGVRVSLFHHSTTPPLHYSKSIRTSAAIYINLRLIPDSVAAVQESSPLTLKPTPSIQPNSSGFKQIQANPAGGYPLSVLVALACRATALAAAVGPQAEPRRTRRSSQVKAGQTISSTLTIFMVNSSLLAACRAAHSESFRGKSTQIPLDEYVTTKIGPFLSGSIKANQGNYIHSYPKLDAGSAFPVHHISSSIDSRSDLVKGFPNRPKLKPKPKVRMTIIAGLIGVNSIVLASDSQTTYGSAKLLNAKKISIVEFANSKALVAESGMADLSGRVVELFQRKAKGVSVTDSETIIQIARDAVREVRNSLIEVNSECNFSDDTWQRFFRDDNSLKLMIAFYFGGIPYIYTIDIYWCVPSRVTSHYTAIGIGDTLAYYLLNEIAEPKMPFKNTLITAIYTIEKVKSNVEGCGGVTQAGIVYNIPDSKTDPRAVIRRRKGLPLPASEAAILPQDDVARYVKRMGELDLRSSQTRNSGIRNMIRAVDREFLLE